VLCLVTAAKLIGDPMSGLAARREDVALIEPLEAMPEGSIGFRATGHVTREEYREVLLPAMRAAAEAGEVRMVFAIGPGFDAFEPGALVEDTKAGITLGIGHPGAWRRTALVTDVDWITKAVHMFGWLTPGELMVRGLDELEEAKAWVAG
jgi:SpoIIAA-like